MLTDKKIQQFGDALVNIFHYVALFVIGGTIVWSAVHEYVQIMTDGHAQVEDILLLFIYLELGAMVGIYFKTHRLPVQFLIYVAITVLARHLVIDLQDIADSFHLYLLLGLTAAILLLSLAIMLLAYSGKHYGRPDDQPIE